MLKLCGKSSQSLYFFMILPLYKIIVKFSESQNSDITCRQTPQGKQKFLMESVVLPPTIAIEQKLFSPSLIALKKAVLSAQFVAEKAAFSMLHPVKIFESLHKRAAPTANFE